jgi:hypothetical protein
LYIPPRLGSVSVGFFSYSLDSLGLTIYFLSRLLHWICWLASPSPPLSHRLQPCCCCWSPADRIHLPTAAGVAGRHRPRLLRRVVRGSWPASVSRSTCGQAHPYVGPQLLRPGSPAAVLVRRSCSGARRGSSPAPSKTGTFAWDFGMFSRDDLLGLVSYLPRARSWLALISFM